MNGLDAGLSTAFSGPPFGGRDAVPRKPGEPPATALDGDIPRGYPPAFLLSGTHDMCLSLSVLLHRKLLNAGVTADLNVSEGIDTDFNPYPDQWHFLSTIRRMTGDAVEQIVAEALPRNRLRDRATLLLARSSLSTGAAGSTALVGGGVSGGSCGMGIL